MIPTAITDFATAIQSICNSQTDVQELVSKWNDIINDQVPKVVSIRLTSGEYAEIKNLAMVERELRESVRTTYPNINTDRVSFTGGSSTAPFSAIYGSTSSHGKGRLSSALTPVVGWTQSSVNDFVTYHVLDKMYTESSKKVIPFSQLPRMVMLGLPETFEGVSNTDTYIQVNPIAAGDRDFDLMYNVDSENGDPYPYYYSCITRFINHSATNDYKVHLFSANMTANAIVVNIPKIGANGLNYADVLFWCGKGIDVVNFSLLNGGGATYVYA